MALLTAHPIIPVAFPDLDLAADVAPDFLQPGDSISFDLTTDADATDADVMAEDAGPEAETTDLPDAPEAFAEADVHEQPETATRPPRWPGSVGASPDSGAGAGWPANDPRRSLPSRMGGNIFNDYMTAGNWHEDLCVHGSPWREGSYTA